MQGSTPDTILSITFKGKGRESIMMTTRAAIKLNYPKMVNMKDHRKPLLFLIAYCLSDLGWVRADALDDLVGPVFITHPSDPTVCLTVDENDRFLAYPLPSDVPPDEPMIVNQVFVGSRLLGSTSRFTFKSYRGKYLSSDKIGVTQCDREAISGLEEWEPVVTEAGVAFQNTHGKFMMVDQVANGGKKKKNNNNFIHTLLGTNRSLWGA